MFGSLRISSCRLGDDSRQTYRASFCGTCHALRDFGGLSASLLTSYDATVMTLIATGLSERPPEVESLRCTALPLRLVGVTRPAPDAERYIAASILTLTAAKLRDDVDDGHPIRGRVGLRLLGGRVQRAFDALTALGAEDVATAVRALPAGQREVEAREPAPSLSDAAAPTANVTGRMFAQLAALSGRPQAADSLRRFGESLGRFVYLWDALVDLEDDRKKRRFNALVAAFGESATPAAFDNPSQESAVLLGLLVSCLDICAQAKPAVSLGAQSAVLDALLASLRSKVRKRLRAADRTHSGAARRTSRAEAGDCDCCAGEACCEGGACDGLYCCDCNVHCCGSDRQTKKKAKPGNKPQGDPPLL